MRVSRSTGAQASRPGIAVALRSVGAGRNPRSAGAGGPSRSGKMLALFALCALAAASGLALALFGPAGVASAHNYLVSSNPAPDSVQTKPLDAVTLEFNDMVLNLDTNTSFVEVTGPDGAPTHFETGCPSVSDRTVTAPVKLGGAGKYQVLWQIVSADGHVVSDTQSFTYEPPAGTPAATGSPTAPCPGSGGSETTQAGSASQPAAPGSEASASQSIAVVLWIAGIVVALAVIGLIVVLVTARRRSEQ